mmetsp:Transcript_28887/g.50818  ORF Transcript_28887/g.50818 Transcript_28887/m.50818 type:complete len:303 (-) Transcript_28887:14-922(-)
MPFFPSSGGWYSKSLLLVQFRMESQSFAMLASCRMLRGVALYTPSTLRPICLTISLQSSSIAVSFLTDVFDSWACLTAASKPLSPHSCSVYERDPTLLNLAFALITPDWDAFVGGCFKLSPSSLSEFRFPPPATGDAFLVETRELKPMEALDVREEWREWTFGGNEGGTWVSVCLCPRPPCGAGRLGAPASKLLFFLGRGGGALAGCPLPGRGGGRIGFASSICLALALCLGLFGGGFFGCADILGDLGAGRFGWGFAELTLRGGDGAAPTGIFGGTAGALVGLFLMSVAAAGVAAAGVVCC